MTVSQSAAYRRFTTYCCEAFNILRKYAPLVINMHSLMKDASIPDFVKTGGDAIPLSRGIDGRRCALTGCVRGGAERGINVLLERFRLDMTDEDAVQHFQDLMDESVTSLMPKLCVPAPLGARRPWLFVCGGPLTECVCGQDGGCARLGYLLEVRRCCGAGDSGAAICGCVCECQHTTVARLCGAAGADGCQAEPI